MPKIKIQEKFQISFDNILKSKWYHAVLLLKTFHLNDPAHLKISTTDLKGITTLHVKIIDSESEMVKEAPFKITDSCRLWEVHPLW